MSVNCYACGVPVNLDPDVERTLRSSGATFYCHAGHAQSFREGGGGVRLDPDDEVGPVRPVPKGSLVPDVCSACVGAGEVSDLDTVIRHGLDGRPVYRKVRCAACRGSGVKGWKRTT